MLDHAVAEQIVETIRAGRLASDIEACTAVMADDVTFEIVGFGAPVVGKPLVTEGLRTLFRVFTFLEWRRLATLVQGDAIATRHHLEVKNNETGKTATTETAEFLSIRDGKCTSFLQFADTGLIRELGTP